MSLRDVLTSDLLTGIAETDRLEGCYARCVSWMGRCIHVERAGECVQGRSEHVDVGGERERRCDVVECQLHCRCG
jgi:hypothetical protein